MPKKIDEQLKARAVRLVTEHQQEYRSQTAACEAVARQLGVGQESVRRWVRQAEVDAGTREGRTTEELAEIRELRARVRRLEADNEILKAATVFFASMRGWESVRRGSLVSSLPRLMLVAGRPMCGPAGDRWRPSVPVNEEWPARSCRLLKDRRDEGAGRCEG